MTASPFLGVASLDPLFATARANGAGVFVLALTSNVEAARVQAARTPTGTVAGDVLRHLAGLNADAGAETDGARGLGSFGAVVGATIGETDEDLAIDGPLLVPGVGAQGGTTESVRRTFAAVLPAVVPSSSREILAAGPEPVALVAAAERAVEAFSGILVG